MTIRYLRMRVDDADGGGIVSIPNTDPQQTRLDIIGDEGWSLGQWANGDDYLRNVSAPPTDTFNVKVDVEAYTKASTMAGVSDVVSPNLYLGENAYVDLDNARMKQVSNQLADQVDPDGNAMTKVQEWAYAQAAFNWVKNNVDYGSVGSATADNSSNQAFNEGYADCTGLSAALVALLREQGIQAVIVKTSWDSNGDGVMAEHDSPTHHHVRAMLPDTDDMDGQHWHEMDVNIAQVNGNYGFAFGGDDKINLGMYGEKSYTSSAVEDIDLWYNSNLIV